MAAVFLVLLEDEEDINEMRFRKPRVFKDRERFTFQTSPSQVRANSTPVGSSFIQRSVGLTRVYIIIIFGEKTRKVCLQSVMPPCSVCHKILHIPKALLVTHNQ